MICQPCGAYTNATVVGQNGGRIPVCDDCIGTEPDAVYKTPTEIFPMRRPSRDSAKHQAVPEPRRSRPQESAAQVAAEAPQASARVYPPTSHAPVVLVLPEPPAANRYLRRHGHVTYKTREAVEYCDLITQLTAQHRQNGQPAFPTGDLSVVVVWHRQRHAGDLGERTKVLYDALQGTVYTDDKQIAQDWRRRVDEHPTLKPGTVRVEISPA